MVVRGGLREPVGGIGKRGDRNLLEHPRHGRQCMNRGNTKAIKTLRFAP